MRITVAFMKKVLTEVSVGKISYSRMVELINEEANRVPKPKESTVFSREECVYAYCPVLTYSQFKTKIMSKQKWTFREWSSAIADTGDYDGGVNLTNGKDVWHTSGEDLEIKDFEMFCGLLDLMPDLWSERTDHAEFMLSQLQKKSDAFEKALKTIKDAFWSDGETGKEQVEDLKAIAFNVLYEAENGMF